VTALPAARLITLRGGAVGDSPAVSGDSTTYPLVAAEPVSIGPPPVLPALIRSARITRALPPARKLTRCGHVVSHGMDAIDTGGGSPRRAVYTLAYGVLTDSQRQQLQDFFALLRWGTRGAGLAMTIRPDGPDGEAVPVRPTGPAPQWTLLGRAGDGGGGGGGGDRRWQLDRFDAEEVG
jgi:hypothetical protein